MAADFNPHKQNISFYNPDGTTVTVGLHELDATNQANVKVSCMFASQIGACALLFTALIMLTKPEKRRAPLFLINAFSLLLVITRSVLQILYFVGPWAETYNYVAYYYEDIPRSDKYISMFSGIAQLVLHVCIMLSLILQIRVVYAAAPTLNAIMTVLSVAVAATSVGFVTATVVQASQAIMSGIGYNEWVYKASRGIFAGAIFFFTGIFSFKLALAIRRRKVLKLQNFGPLQIIFIMGCQTMVVPGKSRETIPPYDICRTLLIA
jgi:pheromone alpha factor receptor